MLADQISGYASLESVDAKAIQEDPNAYLSYQMALAYPYNHIYYSIVGAIRELITQDKPFRTRFGLLRQAVFERICDIIVVGQEAEMTHKVLAFDSIAQTVTNLIFNFYDLLPDPSFGFRINLLGAASNCV